MQPNTLTKKGIQRQIYVKNVSKNSRRIRNYLARRIRIRIRKNYSESTTLVFREEILGIIVRESNSVTVPAGLPLVQNSD
jgi:hypothetical protein